MNDVAYDVKGLATGTTPGERALSALADKLERNSPDLFGVDLTSMYPPSTMLPDSSTPSQWIRVLELARDTLVFVPVAYTWWKLAQALRAYDHYPVDEPFLLAWQHGFGGQTQALASSATVVAGVILLIVLLTVVTYLARIRLDRELRERRQALAVYLAEANLLLSRRRLNAPGVTKDELLALGNQITNSTERLHETMSKVAADLARSADTGPGSRLEQMFTEWVAAARELRQFGDRMEGTQELLGRLGQVQNSLGQMAQRLGGETERMVKALAAERTQSSQEAFAQRELATELHESSQVLGEAMRGLSERAVEFQQIVLRLAFIIENLETTDAGSATMGGFH
jgi:hypothetical protein